MNDCLGYGSKSGSLRLRRSFVTAVSRFCYTEYLELEARVVRHSRAGRRTAAVAAAARSQVGQRLLAACVTVCGQFV